MMKEYNVAIVGATGAVGEKMLGLLENASFPIKSLKLLASKRSAGKVKTFRGQELQIEETTDESFEGIDIALFSAGGGITKQFSLPRSKLEPLSSTIRVLFVWIRKRHWLFLK